MFISIILHVAGTLPDSADDENGLPSPNLVYGEKAYKVFEAETSDEEVISLCAGLVCIVFVSSRSRSIGKLILDYLELSHLRRFEVETTKLGFFLEIPSSPFFLVDLKSQSYVLSLRVCHIKMLRSRREKSFHVLMCCLYPDMAALAEFWISLVSWHCLMMRNRYKWEITLTLAEVYDMQTQMG